jgi:quercetin dioxygenase-like cupin family protein
MEGPASLPPGTKAAVLEGDPKQSGLFTMRVKLPANYKIPPHFHGADEHITVLSGTFKVALGDMFDPSKTKPLTAGSFGVIPMKTPHFAMTSEETAIQLHGMGPWTITYVNPADDPRNRK